MRDNFSKGFLIFFSASILINSIKVFWFSKDIELIAGDLLHLIPALALNELLDNLFFMKEFLLVPIGLTDGLVGGITGLIVGNVLSKANLKGFFLSSCYQCIHTVSVRFFTFYSSF
ncbi:hypothetical protein [Mesobacillus subterraneus]|uniref:Uncharacterized protein n=1 Tax=Mesobacillus subterraneus TaxID=285983 RepID=A0A3R9EXN4_9BACI|nr:hypothetical protein [Mesobacillus subterraneus]RSD25453.1 hypothetical protein EJA10_16740 [Mesobacillus subterraneus]